MPLELALAEPVACAVNAVELADPRLGDDVVIVGAGFMGDAGAEAGAAARAARADRGRHPARGARAGPRDRRHPHRRRALESLVDVVRRTAIASGRHVRRRRATARSGADITFEVTGVAGAALADRRRDPHERQGRDRRLPPGRQPRAAAGKWNWMAFTCATPLPRGLHDHARHAHGACGCSAPGRLADGRPGDATASGSTRWRGVPGRDRQARRAS